MDRLRTLRTFVAVAEQASFAAAARRLNLSPTTVTRTIAALEDSLGIRLLVRTTRSVRLTEQGAAFLERARAGLAEIDLAFAAARGSQMAPRGLLTVTAPVMFGRRYIVPVIAEMLRSHPQLQVRLLLLDRMVRLVDEGIDVAVRIAQLPNSALQLRKIGEVRRVWTASPTYLAARGEPLTVSDLVGHDLVGIEDEIGPQRGADLAAAHAPRLSVNSVEAAVDAAAHGLGIVRTLSYQVAEPLGAGRLRHILADASSPAVPVSLVFPAERKEQPNLRVFTEIARRQLGRTAL